MGAFYSSGPGSGQDLGWLIAGCLVGLTLRYLWRLRPGEKCLPDSQAVLAALDRREQPASGASRVTVLVLLGGSLAAFVAVSRLYSSWKFVLLLVGALLLHEAGHFLAMRAFGFRNIRMVFIPFLGAAVMGLPLRAAGWQKALVALAGPLPGIVLGAVLALAMRRIGHGANPVREFALVLLCINAFNLLPLLPLDGGRFFYETLFSRYAWLRVGFPVATGLGMLALAFQLPSQVLGYLGVIVILSAGRTWRAVGAVDALRAAGVQLLGPAPAPGQEEPVRLEALPSLLDALQDGRQCPARVVVQEAVAVIDQMRARPPAWPAVLRLLALYGAGVAISVFFLFPAANYRDWKDSRGKIDGLKARQALWMWFAPAR